jgi:hypothetical protein
MKFKKPKYTITMNKAGVFFLKEWVTWWKFSLWTTIDSGSFSSIEEAYKKLEK